MPPIKRHAYQDTSLVNLPRETWKSLPLLEGLYLISSHGRIKSLPRERFIVNPGSGDTHYYWTKEKIKKITVHRRRNSFVKKTSYECTISLSLPDGAKTCLVSRLVYQAFISDIDYASDGLNIVHKDGDGLNNHFSNLAAKTKPELLKKAYRLKRHISPFALKTKKEFKEIAGRAAVTRWKKVVQYSLAGRRLRIYDSIQAACLETGITNLIGALKGRLLTSGGFIWRYHPSPGRIAVADLHKRQAERWTKYQKAVEQYSGAGKLLKKYQSIAEAAARTGVPTSSISNCLAGRRKTAGGFRWNWPTGS